MSQPVVLLMSLKKEEYWDEMYSDLVDIISSKATIQRVVKSDAAIRYLTSNVPSSIIVTDAALTKTSDRSLNPLRQKLVEYVQQGGTVVLATHFSTFVKPFDMNRWFSSTWNLPWQSGDYHRTTVHLNPGCEMLGGSATTVPASYSQKAVLLKNVDVNAKVYAPSDHSRVESQVFRPTPVDTEQAAVAMAKVGEGWLGYIGDVNNEAETHKVLLTMLGL